VTVALVTGAGRGVGKVIAEGLAREGFLVAVVARTTGEIEATAAELDGAIAITADVTKADEVGRAVTQAEAELGAIDLLVNNAGAARAIGPAWDVDPEDWWSALGSALAATGRARDVGAITYTSMLSTSESARRAACSPSAAMPSSFVSRTFTDSILGRGGAAAGRPRSLAGVVLSRRRRR